MSRQSDFLPSAQARLFSRAMTRLTPLRNRCSLEVDGRSYADLACVFDPHFTERDLKGVPLGADARPVCFVSFADLDPSQEIVPGATITIGAAAYEVDDATLQADGMWRLGLRA